VALVFHVHVESVVFHFFEFKEYFIIKELFFKKEAKYNKNFQRLTGIG